MGRRKNQELISSALLIESSTDAAELRRALLLLAEHPGFLARKNQILAGVKTKSLTPQQWAGIRKNIEGSAWKNHLHDYLKKLRDNRPAKRAVDDAIKYMKEHGVPRIPKDPATIEKEIRLYRKQIKNSA